MARPSEPPLLQRGKEPFKAFAFEDAVMDSLYFSAVPALMAVAIIGYSLFQAYA